jgi:hypothetical protein
VFDCNDFCSCEDRAACDSVCRNKPDQFFARYLEIGGFELESTPRVDALAIPELGRPGQAQDGVDVYAARSRVGSVGVQCKRLDDLDENNRPLPGGPIDRKLLRSEAEKAISFRPKLDVWILARLRGLAGFEGIRSL